MRELAGDDLAKLKIERSGRSLSARRRSSRRAAGVVLVLALVGLAWAIARFGASAEVETLTVGSTYPSQPYTLLNATGYVVAQRKAAVSSKGTGRLEWLGVLEGSRVKEGDIIARLENRDVAAAQQQAAANIKVAQANLDQGMAELRDAEVALKRSQGLVDKGFISRSAHDSAIARYDKARASIASLRAVVAAAIANEKAAAVAVEQTLIRAPFDGVVLTKSANVGDIVTPFSSALDAKGAVVTMADMDTLEVEADVSESNLAKISQNQPCEIQLDALPELRFAGVVNRMVPTIDRAKATLLVKVRFVERDPRILPEMSAKVAFLSRQLGANERHPVTVTQRAALTSRNGRNVAFLVDGNKVRETPIEVGQTIGDLVEVKGVKPGDRLVLNPSQRLRDGGSIRLLAK
jgi:RND family efflux transporter MFP subunit